MATPVLRAWGHNLRERVASGVALLILLAVALAIASYGCAPDGERRENVAKSSAALSSAIWEKMTPIASPPPQYSTAMAYDSARKVTVLLSSVASNPDAGTTDAETWLYDGTNWSLQNPTNSPPLRSNGCMAYDSVRGRTVLFGGETFNPVAFYNETWEWDGNNWQKMAPSGTLPVAQSCTGALAFDSRRGVSVLWGNGSQTWEYDGTSWTRKSPTNAPSSRSSTAIAYDSGRGKTVLFGGFGSGWFNEVWEYDGVDWTLRTPTVAPDPRQGSSMAYDSARSRIVMNGGVRSAFYQDTWEWDGTIWTKIAPSVDPPGRAYTSMAYDSLRGRIVMFGGQVGGPPSAIANETWEYHQRGGACGSASVCDTGYCLDGVCCETATCGSCESCNLATPGTCYPIVSAPDPDSCSGTQTCSSTGACKKVVGQPCNADTDCDSAHCVDGFCCNTACSGSCDVCAATLGAPSNGTCGPAPAGTLGSPSCNGYRCTGSSASCATSCTGDASCAPGYFCTAAAKCEPYRSQGAGCNTAAGGDCLVAGCHVCATNLCVDGYCCNAACTASCDRCDVTPGTCGAATAGSVGSPSCGNYLCNGTSTSCPTSCTSDTQCGTGAHCSGGTCQANLDFGGACAADVYCKSGHCVDGVCCDTACNGICQACTQALKASGADGTCGNVAAGQDPHGSCPDDGPTSCGRDGSCDGQGGCRYYTKGLACGTTGCVGNLVTGQICNGLGSCTAASTGTDCAPYVCSAALGRCAIPCTSDAECTLGNFCDAGVCKAKLINGAPCIASTQCSSGFCVEGVCCDSLCTGTCQACAAANKQSGSDGVCGYAKAGLDPHETCPDDGTISCGRTGACDGAGGCSKYAAGTVCGATACVGNVQTGYACNGTGACVASSSTDCGDYLCRDAACTTSCTIAADCSANAFCKNGACTPRQKNGLACSDRVECESNICVDHVCCVKPCQGQCEACDVPGAEGTCAAVTGAAHGDRAACPTATADAPCLAASCDGVERTRCAAYVGPTVSCRPASCDNDVATLEAFCDGQGSCPASETKPCDPYVCGGGACKTSCAADADCQSGNRCTNGQCALGAVCVSEHSAKNPNGTLAECAPFRCDAATGACLSSCKTSDDCSTSNVCASGKCRSAQAAASSDQGDSGCGCRVAQAERRRGGELALFVLASVAFARRRRTSTSNRKSTATVALGRFGAFMMLCAVLALGACSADSGPSSAVSTVAKPSRFELALRLAANAPLLAHRIAPATDGFVSDGGFITSPGWRSAATHADRMLGARLPLHADGALEVGVDRSERYRLRLTLEGAAGVQATTDRGRVIYDDALPSIDVLYVAEPRSVEALFILRNAQAPKELVFRVERGAGLTAVERERTGALLFDAEQNRPELRVLRPYLIDAHGVRRDLDLDWRDGRLALKVDTAGLDFPVLVDPAIEVPVWKLADAGIPMARTGFGLAWDSVRQRTVLFGGISTIGGPQNDTWEWDGARWMLVSNTGPSTASDFGMAYDAAIQRTVVYGGSNSTDTWEWDGTSWSSLTTATNLGVQSPTMVYDSARSRLVAFGNGTYEFDGTNWKLVAAAGTPSSRNYPAMAYDAARGKTVLFGGCDSYSCDTTYKNDTWEWDGSSWTPVVVGSPPPARGRAGMQFDAARGQVILFGGRASTQLADTWAWDGISWTPLSPVTSPPAREGQRIVYDTVKARLMLFGGGTGYAYANDDVWEWTGSTWLKPPQPPRAVQGSMMAYDSARTSIVLFGGVTYTQEYIDTTHTWNGTAWTPQTPSNKPKAREYGMMTFDSARGRTVLFGGWDGTNYLGDTWEWDGANWTDKTPGSSPPARGWASMAYDVVRARTVLFGGYDNVGNRGDTWLWDGTSWTPQTPGTPPSARGEATAAWDSALSRVLILGGYTDTGSTAETWNWSGSDWSLLAPAKNPGARFGEMMAGDTARKRVVLYGGGIGNGIFQSAQDTWEWNGTTWAQITVSAPSARYGGSMAFDAARGKSTLFGGNEGGDNFSETWVYSTYGGACTLNGQCDTGFCVDGVCCSVASCGTCEGCNLSTPGICTKIANADDPNSCSGTCDATSTCKKKPGQACSLGSECITGYCADGVCCDTPCSAACDVCNLTPGTCTPAAAGSAGNPSCSPYICDGVSTSCPTSCTSDAACATSTYCSASGQCQPKRAVGAGCNTAAGKDCLVAGCQVCASGQCVDGYCCSSACSGQCDTCAATPGTCTPSAVGSPGAPSCAPSLCNGTSTSCATSCSSDAQCAANGFCRASDGTCQLDQAPGAPCTSASQCVSGFCVDGVCCQTACTGNCQACKASLKTSGTPDGVCDNALNGTDPHDTCSDDGAGSCKQDGLCNGSGACRLYALTTVCGDTSCVGNSVRGYICDGLGSCVLNSSGVDCAPYVCAGTSCRNPCAGDADCTAGNYCDAGTCRAKLTLGSTCSAANQCQSSFCVENVCCNTACNGVCQACAATNQVAGLDGGAPVNGQCGFAKAGVDPHDDCAQDPIGSCARDGMCDGAGACRSKSAGTPCGATICAQDTQTGYACDGAGSCLTNSVTPCAPYGCGGGNACATTCIVGTDCYPGYWCDTSSGPGQCKAMGGEPCVSPLECTTGYCVDGHCCNSDCRGQCEACDVPGAQGTCAPVTGTPHGSRLSCATGSASEPCAATRCDGETRDSCAGFVGPELSCRQAGCTNGTATLSAYCDGLGSCPQAVTKDCSPYACGSVDCKTSCSADTDCAAGLHCADSKCVKGDSCDGNHTLTKSNGDTYDCAPYHCDPSGVCKTTCTTSSECVAPNVCSSAGKCVNPKASSAGATNSGGCGCRTPRGSNTDAGGLAIVGLLLAGYARRRSVPRKRAA